MEVGRSERTNETVGQILQSFASKRQGKWFDLLPAAEFAINLVVNVSTGVSLLELLFGRPPLLFTENSTNDSPLALSKWLKI
jgi:hypothetical protein